MKLFGCIESHERSTAYLAFGFLAVSVTLVVLAATGVGNTETITPGNNATGGAGETTRTDEPFLAPAIAFGVMSGTVLLFGLAVGCCDALNWMCNGRNGNDRAGAGTGPDYIREPLTPAGDGPAVF